MALASSSAQRHVGITERCPCLGGCVLRDSALRIRAVPALSNLPRIESASTGTLLSPSVPSAPRTNSGSDSGQEGASSSRFQLPASPETRRRISCRGRAINTDLAQTQPPLRLRPCLQRRSAVPACTGLAAFRGQGSFRAEGSWGGPPRRGAPALICAGQESLRQPSAVPARQPATVRYARGEIGP